MTIEIRAGSGVWRRCWSWEPLLLEVNEKILDKRNTGSQRQKATEITWNRSKHPANSRETLVSRLPRTSRSKYRKRLTCQLEINNNEETLRATIFSWRQIDEDKGRIRGRNWVMPARWVCFPILTSCRDVRRFGVWCSGHWRRVQEVRTEHIQQEQVQQLLQAEGGAQRRGSGMQQGEFSWMMDQYMRVWASFPLPDQFFSTFLYFLPHKHQYWSTLESNLTETSLKNSETLI